MYFILLMLQDYGMKNISFASKHAVTAKILFIIAVRSMYKRYAGISEHWAIRKKMLFVVAAIALKTCHLQRCGN